MFSYGTGIAAMKDIVSLDDHIEKTTRWGRSYFGDFV